MKLMIKNEIMVLRKVIHPGIIRLYEVIQEKDRLVLIMELVQGGDLYSLIKEKKKIPERESAYMLKGVCEALAEMHKYSLDMNLGLTSFTATSSWKISCSIAKTVTTLSSSTSVLPSQSTTRSLYPKQEHPAIFPQKSSSCTPILIKVTCSR